MHFTLAVSGIPKPITTTTSSGKSNNNNISTPNLPTSTPIHYQQQRTYYQASSPNKSEASSASISPVKTNSIAVGGCFNNGSSGQLAKAEEKIQGRGMCRSNASYGIQQMLQDQVSPKMSEAARPNSGGLQNSLDFDRAVTLDKLGNGRMQISVSPIELHAAVTQTRNEFF